MLDGNGNRPWLSGAVAPLRAPPPPRSTASQANEGSWRPSDVVRSFWKTPQIDGTERLVQASAWTGPDFKYTLEIWDIKTGRCDCTLLGWSTVVVLEVSQCIIDGVITHYTSIWYLKVRYTCTSWLCR